MFDVRLETPLSLSDAARSLPPVDGRHAHLSTIFRWIRRGLRGVRLEHARIGHRVVTSAEALSRFARALAEADRNPSPTITSSSTSTHVKPRSPAARARAVEAAKRELAAAGV